MLTRLKYFYNNHNKWYLTILGIGFVFLLWVLISLGISSSLFPNPGIVIPDLCFIVSQRDTWAAIGGTMLRLLIGFVISFISAIILGYFGGRYEGFYKFLSPLVTTLRTLPTAAIIYVLIVLTKPMYALVIILTLLMFPILYEAVANGVKHVNKNAVEAMKLDTGYTFSSVRRIIIG